MEQPLSPLAISFINTSTHSATEVCEHAGFLQILSARLWLCGTAVQQFIKETQKCKELCGHNEHLSVL